jgi:putative inorganic carbon (hco3(-)) transporter
MPERATAWQRVGAPLSGPLLVLLRHVGLLSLAIFVLFMSYNVNQTYGLAGLAVFSVIAVALVLMAIVSARHLQIAVLVWVVTIAGFRNLLILDLPGLPDLTPDRMVLMWIVAVMLLRILVAAPQTLPPYLPDVLIVLHTLYLLGSCLIANPEAFNLWNRAYLMPAAGYFMGKYLLRDDPWLRRVIKLLAFINLYMGLMSIFEHFQLTALIWPKSILTPEVTYVGRSVGVFQNPGVLGIFIGMVLPLQFYLHLTERTVASRWFHVVGIVVCIVGLFFTYTRGPWLAAAAGLVVLALLRPHVYLQRLLVYSVIVGVVLGLGLISFKQDAFLQQRLHNENTIEGRINVAATSYRMFQRHPLLGVGFKRFNDLKSHYRETLYVPFFGLIKAEIDTESSPHDIYIAVLAEEGLVGGVLQGWIYFVLLRSIASYYWRGRQRSTKIDAYLLPPIVAMIVCYFVGGFAFDYRFFETLNSLFYTFAGVAVGWAAVRNRARATVESLAVGQPSHA